VAVRCQRLSSLREFDLLPVINDYVQDLSGKCEIQLKLDAGYDRDAIVQTLRRGGPDSISLFLQVSIDLHDSGGMSAMNGWIKVGLPALP
jgi:hypothetical protein